MSQVKEQLERVNHGEPPVLSPYRAFVVQFRDLPMERGHFAGRVEHMTSGRVTCFQSQEELWTFMKALST